ncbi:hypothetical protein LRH25_18980 [Ideonella azotifigens]|uniref:Tetratricopeptide repeat protein n=1 Tax=Ideonella azotifigens TaxID=513160 RepID=A0ABN1K5K7_9BURK|nr:hypothetical protein [Ideonella azotifigens]MCD2342415.1 hypothetical protein [Ideonella azotifigens]
MHTQGQARFVAACTAALALTAMLAGCAQDPARSLSQPAAVARMGAATPAMEALLADGLFAAPRETIDTRDLFAVNTEMLHFLRGELSPFLHSEGNQRGLYEALQSTKYLKLDYDATQTRTAAEAFKARSGNCLSLVILTAALGHRLGLQVSFRQVLDEDTWGLSGDMVVASGHVNVILGQRNWMAFGRDSQALVVDFMPSEAVRGRRARLISEDDVVAMFENNRAVESMAQGDLDTAYWWARAAVSHEKPAAAAVNTLGVIYQRRQLPAMAEQAYRQALALEPTDLRSLANLAGLMRSEGRDSEATPLDQRIAKLMPQQPFHHFRLGLAAAQRHDWLQARDELTRELERDPTFQDAQAWLAQVYLELGDLPNARSHLALAAKNGSTPGNRALYAAKLEHLRAVSQVAASR